MTLVLDYSSARPDPAAMRAAGVAGVMRYASGSAKGLTSAELGALHGAGLGVGLVFEEAADRATQGAVAGANDARYARRLAKGFGWPTAIPVFVVIQDQAGMTWVQVAPYVAGWASVMDVPSAEFPQPQAWGAYGGAPILTAFHAAHPAGFVWQTSGWSNKVRLPFAALFQDANHASPIPGTDYNDCADPSILWSPDVPLTPADISAIVAAVHTDTVATVLRSQEMKDMVKAQCVAAVADLPQSGGVAPAALETAIRSALKSIGETP